MAIANNYDSNSIIGKYIKSCEQTNMLLNETQIGLLKKTFNESFGITKLPKLSKDVFKPFDWLHTTGRLDDIIKKIPRKELGNNR